MVHESCGLCSFTNPCYSVLCPNNEIPIRKRDVMSQYRRHYETPLYLPWNNKCYKIYGLSCLTGNVFFYVGSITVNY